MHKVSVIFFLFALVATQQTSDNSSQFSVCHNEHSFTRRDLHRFAEEKRAHADPVGQLFKWCSSDALCADAYHISMNRTKTDETTFRYIAAHWLHMRNAKLDLMQPFNETVCTTATFDDLLRLLWIIGMRLNVREKVRIECGPNEQATLDIETMQLHCVCAPDRKCFDTEEWRETSLNWSNVTVSIASLTLFIASILLIRNAIERRAVNHRLLLECQDKCGCRVNFLKQL